ncbi:MAG TPA: hypothetical protein HA349_00145 [Methanotrichaceae archaeon]|nr:hypothetical protein [Methanotrichaceae archaeon]
MKFEPIGEKGPGLDDDRQLLARVHEEFPLTGKPFLTLGEKLERTLRDPLQ